MDNRISVPPNVDGTENGHVPVVKSTVSSVVRVAGIVIVAGVVIVGAVVVADVVRWVVSVVV